MRVARVEEMRRLDQQAVSEFEIPEDILMENAGQAAYSVIQDEFGIEGTDFLIISGIGNNGGDGLVAARKIHSMGGTAVVRLAGDPGKFRGAAKRNYERVLKLGLDMKTIPSSGALANDFRKADIIIDALFGTGLKREVEGFFKKLISSINQSGKPVLSLDIPSGINGNTGQEMGISIQAEGTVTFGLPKVGNLLYPGFSRGGTLYISHISFPPQLTCSPDLAVSINIPVPLPERKEEGHKGTFGDALFIAGASNYFGAPCFAALSFLKSGGGYSRLASPASIVPFIAGKGSEIVFVPLKETGEGSIAAENRTSLLKISGQVDLTVLRPGLSLNAQTQQLVRELVQKIERPLLIDGDGITAVADDPALIKKRKYPTVLTPHMGEMSRISGCPIAEIEKNRMDILQETCQDLKSWIILKGAHTLIGSPDGRVSINMSGNSGMATAGSGDVLTGSIAAMFGLGLSLEDAVKAGVFMHGFAGDLAAWEIGEDGITAQDIMDHLPEALRHYRENYDALMNDFYASAFRI